VRIDDERDLHERLDRAFETITPRPAPVDGTIRRGKAIKGRRRVAAAVAVAAVVAVGVITVPSLHRLAGPAPVPGSGHYTVTVQPPGPGSRAGLIASGTVNGKRWEIGADKPQAGHDIQQLYTSGPAYGPEEGIAAPNRPVGTDPVFFQSAGSGTIQSEYGTVRADVSYVTVRLGNGTVLTLHPVTVYGTRVIAFAFPGNAVIVNAIAYSRHGEIATAVPFNKPADGFFYFGVWLKPGQHGIARASGLIGSGTAGGSAWSASADLGPWGFCVITSWADVKGASACADTLSQLPTMTLDSASGGTLQVSVGAAPPSAVRIVVHQANGTTTQVRPVAIGGQKLFAFLTGADSAAWNWTAYGSSGAVVASSAG
jgi:hypothetical protein